MEFEQTIDLSSIELERYKSQINLCQIGVEGQKKLKAASIVVVGAGGLGCSALLYLLSAGVGKLGIIDHDRVELGNLHRQILYHDEDIGQLKSEAAKQRLSLHNPNVKLSSHPIFLQPHNAAELIEDYDLVIDATDNFAAKYAINDACLQKQKPFVYGSIHQFEGQVAVFNAKLEGGLRGPDYRMLYPCPPPPNTISTCSEGIIGALPGIVGAIQALEAIKMILNIMPNLSGKLLKLDALSWSTQLFQINPSKQSLSYPLEIDSDNLREMFQQSEEIQLIDIREGVEVQGKPLIGQHLPLSKLFENLSMLKSDKKIVLYCQKGFRSLNAAKKLRDHFSSQEISCLKGGVETLSKKNDAKGHGLFPFSKWAPASIEVDVKFFARCTASTILKPLAKKAAMAAEKVQPVPCVFFVFIFGEENQ